MRFSLAALAALAVGAAANDYTTEVVTEYTTYCPSATAISHRSSTWSVTAPTTLTMSGGPYTVTRPMITSTVTRCNKWYARNPTLVCQ